MHSSHRPTHVTDEHLYDRLVGIGEQPSRLGTVGLRQLHLRDAPAVQPITRHTDVEPRFISIRETPKDPDWPNAVEIVLPGPVPAEFKGDATFLSREKKVAAASLHATRMSRPLCCASSCRPYGARPAPRLLCCAAPLIPRFRGLSPANSLIPRFQGLSPANLFMPSFPSNAEAVPQQPPDEDSRQERPSDNRPHSPSQAAGKGDDKRHCDNQNRIEPDRLQQPTVKRRMQCPHGAAARTLQTCQRKKRTLREERNPSRVIGIKKRQRTDAEQSQECRAKQTLSRVRGHVTPQSTQRRRCRWQDMRLVWQRRRTH